MFIKSNQNHKKGNLNPKLPHSGNKNILAYIEDRSITINQIDDIIKQLYTERFKGERSCIKCPYKTPIVTLIEDHVEGHARPRIEVQSLRKGYNICIIFTIANV